MTFPIASALSQGVSTVLVCVVLSLIWGAVARRARVSAEKLAADPPPFGDRVFKPQRWILLMYLLILFASVVVAVWTFSMPPKDHFALWLLAALFGSLCLLGIVDYFRSYVAVEGSTVKYQGFIRSFQFDLYEVQDAQPNGQFITVNVGRDYRYALPTVVTDSGLLVLMLNNYRPEVSPEHLAAIEAMRERWRLTARFSLNTFDLPPAQAKWDAIVEGSEAFLKPFRDALAAEMDHVSEIRPIKPCGAGFEVKRQRFSFSILFLPFDPEGNWEAEIYCRIQPGRFAVTTPAKWEQFAAEAEPLKRRLAVFLKSRDAVSDLAFYGPGEGFNGH